MWLRFAAEEMAYWIEEARHPLGRGRSVDVTKPTVRACEMQARWNLYGRNEKRLAGQGKA